MKKEFYELKELTMYLRSEKGISKHDKKILCDYFNDKEEFQDEAFILISEEETIQQLKNEMEQETLVYFNSSFLARYTDLDIEVLKAIQSLEYKGNEALVKIFEDEIECIAEDAIQEDGAGHFINYYDGSYEKITINGEVYYFSFN